MSKQQKKSLVPGGLRFVFYACLIVVAAVLIYYGITSVGRVRTEKLHSLVENQLEQCQELILMKNRYSDIITIKKRALLGIAKSYSIVRYTGILRVGLADISQSKITVSDNGRALRIKLPACTVLGNDIVSQAVFDESRNIFVPIKTQEIFDEIEASRADTADDLIEEGILDDADERARLVVSRLMYDLGFTRVIIE
jgi:hypothetical protein